MTDVCSDVDESLRQATEGRVGFRIRRYLKFHYAQHDREGGDLLENAVVQFSGDANPLRLLRFDQLFIQSSDLELPSLDAPDAEVVNTPQQQEQGSSNDRPEPRRVPPRRQ